MARNEEKALTLFNKWQTFKKDFHAVGANKRPLVAAEGTSLLDCDKHRRDIVRDLTKNIAAIRNATLGEHKIRELNDDINKLMKKKHYWEIRIRELGGNVPIGKQYYDIEGKELPGAPGYRYYGAAKDLPGVRELFAEHDDDLTTRRQKKRSRADLYKFVTPDYYGYRDDEDGVLVPLEAAREIELREQMRAESSDEEDAQLRALRDISSSILSPRTMDTHTASAATREDEETGSEKEEAAALERQRRLEDALMEKKKAALLSQFM